MPISRNQIVMVGGTILVILVFVLIFTGTLPGLQQKKGGEIVQGGLNFWGVGEKEENFLSAIGSFKKIYPGVDVKYRYFENELDYSKSLLDALAAGAGPDIFMIRNNSLASNANKISPLPETKMTVLQLRELFPQVVEGDFAPGGIIYALPLSIDTLALIYNRDLLDQAGVFPPETWEDFIRAIPKILKSDQSKKITRAASAIGGSNKNIDSATDILNLLMLQTGTKMISKESGSASFASKEGLDALTFYVSFSDAAHPFYTWNSGLPNSIEAMKENLVAMIFNYSSAISKIKNGANLINLAVAPAPQPKEAKILIAYPRYWAFTVSKQSKIPNVAWDFISNLTIQTENANGYVLKTGHPPALRSLIASYEKDPDLGVFAKQALIARDYPQVDPIAIDEIFSEMIEFVITNRLTTESALARAQEKVNQLMIKRF